MPTPTTKNIFKGSDTKFGIFYPTGYLVAVFPDMTGVRKAEKALGFHGYLDEDVVIMPGDEVIRFAEENLKHKGAGGLLMQQLSRMFATEEVYTDHDLELAEKGAGFLAVYCPLEERRRPTWELIEPFGPVVGRHYALDGVEHFRGEL
jgi:hypothetical protein